MVTVPIGDFYRDVAYGWRSLMRARGFFVVVVLTLALGIGANVAMFSVVYSVLWRPLPYPNADRVVVLSTNIRRVADQGLSSGEIADLRANGKTLETIASISGVDANLNVDDQLERVYAISSTDDSLAALGALPLTLGRSLKATDDIGKDGFVRAVLISDALFKRRFGGDRATIGRHIQVNNIDCEIAGVVPAGFRVYLPAIANAAENVDIWFPAPIDLSEQGRRGRAPLTIARLRPGVSLAQAQAELDTLGVSAFAANPGSYPASSADYEGDRLTFVVKPLQDVLTARVRPALLALIAAVSFVLLIAGVNVMNLLLSRASARQRELAVRRALGASRSRLVRQLFAESAILALLGGAAGLILALWGVDLLDWLRPTHLPRQSQIAVDAPVALYAALVSTAICFVFGILPGLRVTSRDDNDALRATRGSVGGRERRLQRSLVIAEVALSIVPLVASGLMMRTVWNLTHAPIGFDPNNIVTAKVAASFKAFPTFERRWQLNRDALDRVRKMPGIDAVSAVQPLPLGPFQFTRQFSDADNAGSPRLTATYQMVFPDYVKLMRTQLRAGREFTDEDVRNKRMVTIVDERIARRLWPDGAIGKHLAMHTPARTTMLEVIGVTEPVRATRVSDAEVANVMLPIHLGVGDVSMVIRTTRSASTLEPSLKTAVESLGTGRPLVDVKSMNAYVANSIAESRFNMLLLTGFAAASLLLAAVGLYGTLAYLISQRQREFGVRVALGASVGDVIAMVVRESAWLTGIGAAIGVAGVIATAGLVRGLLYQVAPLDPRIMALVIGLLAMVATIATIMPALRASRVDPTTVLRDQ
jgi:putative ABC transport system permease protein